MFKYTCLNVISEKGTSLFGADFEKTEDIREADAVMIRSASMHEMELPPMLEAVARAGAGVNNIPLEKCAEQGIVVFNTPGANANAVAELSEQPADPTEDLAKKYAAAGAEAAVDDDLARLKKEMGLE